MSAGAGDSGVAEGGGGAQQTLEEEAEYSGKAGGRVAKGSGGGRGGEPEVREWFVWMKQRENKRHSLDDIIISLPPCMFFCISWLLKVIHLRSISSNSLAILL